MDGTTEPLIAVIGHPIAGNPTQFAIERALDAMKLEWRVMSFDVRPEDLATALDGFSVTGIAGVLIDPSVAEVASQWLASKRDAGLEELGRDGIGSEHSGSDDSGQADLAADDVALDTESLFDCLYRDQNLEFQGSDEQRRWIDALILEHGGENRIWIGDSLRGTPLPRERFPDDPQAAPPDPDAVASANVVVITDGAGGPVSLDVEDWPRDDGATLVIDLTDGHPDSTTIAALGYRLVTPLQRRVGTLSQCLQRWTGQQPSAEVIHDAIEEYLGV